MSGSANDEGSSDSSNNENPSMGISLAAIIVMSICCSFGPKLLELQPRGYGLSGYGGFGLWMLALLLILVP